MSPGGVKCRQWSPMVVNGRQQRCSIRSFRYSPGGNSCRRQLFSPIFLVFSPLHALGKTCLLFQSTAQLCMIKINRSLPVSYNKLWVVICLLAAFGLASCGTTRNYVYLKNIEKDTTISGLVSRDFESKIQPGDQLSIVVTSLSASEDEQFNKAASVSTSPAMSGFTVYPDGKVVLHRLGRVQAAGLTRRELQEKLQKDLLGYMKEPIVNVGYLNHKVTVIGAVGTAKVLPMPEEQLNIFEVLVNSGDIKPEGMKDKVMVVREEGGTKRVRHLNLEDKAIFNDPWYYVKADDIVYVKPDLTKQEQAEKRARTQNTIAMATGAASFLLIIIDRVTR